MENRDLTYFWSAHILLCEPQARGLREGSTSSRVGIADSHHPQEETPSAHNPEGPYEMVFSVQWLIGFPPF